MPVTTPPRTGPVMPPSRNPPCQNPSARPRWDGGHHPDQQAHRADREHRRSDAADARASAISSHSFASPATRCSRPRPRCRSPARSVRRTGPRVGRSAARKAIRMNANTLMTARGRGRPDPKSRANTGRAGATMPKPSATKNATATRMRTSRGSGGCASRLTARSCLVDVKSGCVNCWVQPAVRHTFTNRSGCKESRRAGSASSCAQVVAHDVVAEAVAVGGEDPAAVAGGHRLDEPDQPGSSSSMKTLIVAPRRVTRSTSASVAAGSRGGSASRTRRCRPASGAPSARRR